MKYYALLDPYTRSIKLHITRKAIAEELKLNRSVDKDLSFLNLDSNRYKVGRVKARYNYPKGVKK